MTSAPGIGFVEGTVNMTPCCSPSERDKIPGSRCKILSSSSTSLRSFPSTVSPNLNLWYLIDALSQLRIAQGTGRPGVYDGSLQSRGQKRATSTATVCASLVRHLVVMSTSWICHLVRGALQASNTVPALLMWDTCRLQRNVLVNLA